MSFGIPVRNGLGVGLLASTFLSSLRIGGRPAMSLDFIGTNSLDSRVTFTRGTTATFVGSDGYIQTAAIDAPRFDYDPVTLAPKGLLIEEARTNLFMYSEQFDNVVWTKTAATVTANSTTSPSGTATADTLQATAGTGVTPRVADASVLTVNGSAHTASMYVKAGTYTFFQIYLSSQSGEWANFTLTGAGSASANGASTATIQSVGAGWYRISMTYTAGGIDRRPFFMLAASASATRGQAWNPVGTETVFIWGAQLEVGAFATSYIPTTLLATTRNADVANMTGTNFSSWYNQTEGTFVLSGSVFANQGATTVDFLQASDGLSNSIAIDLGMFDLPAPFFAVSNTTTQANLDLGTLALNSVFNMVGAYKVNDFAGTINGGTVQTDTSGTVPSGIVQLGIGNRLSGQYMNGHIRRIAYYNTRLSNAAVQALTA
jgi:hypothetical protein